MENIVAVLSLGTIGFVLAFAYVGMRSAEKGRDPETPKSALSRDGIEERIAAGVYTDR